MSQNAFDEKLIETTVTYTVIKDDRFYIVEGVPARVNVETGEQLFAPETVEKLQQIVWEKKKPVREMTTPVYEFAG